MSNLKLEVGKYYRTRCGIKAKLMEFFEGQWFGAILSDSGRWLSREWHESGKYNPPVECSMDLISEWNDDDEWEDADPSKITLDMLPMVARFRNEEDWHTSMMYGYWRESGIYLCASRDFWKYCQIRKEEK